MLELREIYQPDDNELIRFHVSLGKTVSEFHKFEYLLAVVLCVVKNEEFKDTEDAWNALDRDFKMVLGKLNTQLNASVYFVDTFRYHIAEIVRERNWIVHKLPGAMYLFTKEKREFERLISRLDMTRNSCSSIRLILEEWFFNHEEYKVKIRSLPVEVLVNFQALKIV
ncbi:MAG: hypothetical protein H6R07_2305 [Proteobacteria bacterium]|nr:hypothetical protein [Pseudomonadota bacterium]